MSKICEEDLSESNNFSLDSDLLVRFAQITTKIKKYSQRYSAYSNNPFALGNTKNQKLNEPLIELKNAYEAYLTAFNNYTTDFFEKRLNESKKEDIKDMNICLIRIINAIINLSEVIDSGQNLNIKDTNANFVDIAGIASNVNTRYNQLPEKDELLVNVHSDFTTCLKILNDDIILKCNETHEQKVYTITEAYNIYRQNMPPEM